MTTKHAFVRAFQPDDLAEVIGNIRDQDRIEVQCASGLPHGKCLERVAKYSDDIWTAVIDGKIVAIFGINSISALTKSGIPWFISTKEIENHPLTFLRHCKTVFDIIARDYRNLENYVHVDNTVAILWLKWLGFQLDEAKPFGANGELFHKFNMRKENV